jgi:hypothetical protein
MSEDVFDAIAVIAVRKSKFYERSRDVPQNMDQKRLRGELRKAISGLDNDLFIGQSEKATKKLDPSAPIEKLGLDSEKIIDAVLQKLSTR